MQGGGPRAPPATNASNASSRVLNEDLPPENVLSTGFHAHSTEHSSWALHFAQKSSEYPQLAINPLHPHPLEKMKSIVALDSG